MKDYLQKDFVAAYLPEVRGVVFPYLLNVITAPEELSRDDRCVSATRNSRR
jgi:hypothetical protein